MVEFPIGGPASGLAIGPDGNIWFTEVLDYRVGYLVPATGFAPDFWTGTRGGDITTGPDGNLWFTGLSVYSTTTSGMVRGGTIRLGTSGAGAIASGPDGALWFTEGDAFKIGRTTTDWSLQEYPLDPGLRPIDIIAGPDGNLWIAELVGHVARITPTGEITQFPLAPGRDVSPVALAVGPDGNIWFTAASSNRTTNAMVGKVDGQGHITLYPLPTSTCNPKGITAAPDGNLWFVESSVDRIGRVTTKGEITEYQLSTRSAGLAAIVASPDGTLWFSGSRFSTIGSMRL